jgi:hypothetical protein
MAAPSKGGFVAEMPNRAILISRKEMRIEEETSKPERGAAEGQASAPLNVLDEEADPCCRRALQEMGDKRLAPWDCQTCWLHFVAEMIGPLRNWRIKPRVVVRPPR